VFIGAAYLRYLKDMYHGDIELALTAYNQGYGRVNNLLAKNKANSLRGIIKDLGPDGRAYAHNVLGLASRMSG
jgi:soluble lytic murein transglycosylase-like protein